MESITERMVSNWTISEHDHVPAFIVHLHEHSYVLPWHQFLFAEGSAETIRASFTTHEVLIQGHGLQPLITDLALQRVNTLREPHRTDRFGSAPGPQIKVVEVFKAADAEEE
jgi:hypothetical protein